jgi:nucleotide-binding universal stress UspA family protein
MMWPSACAPGIVTSEGHVEIKRILVGLGTSASAESVSQHAIDIARPTAAELVGLAVTDPLRLEWTGPRPMGIGVSAASADLVRQRQQRVAADIAKAGELFATRCRAANVQHRITEETGDPFEIAADLVRYHDMCVFGLRGLFEHDVVPEPRDALERLVSQGVRPILAVGERYRPIRRVLVAYSGSLESAKTFKHFVHSGLYADAPVRVVHFGDDAQVAARRLEKAAAFFAAHGRVVETDHEGGSADHDLLSYAEAWKADLIVAGNSAKNLLLRRVFGETALRLIRESPLPLYLAQ